MFTPINRFKAYLSRLILTEIEILLDLFKGQSLVSIKNKFTKTKSRRKEIWFGTVSKRKVCRSYLAKESEKREEKKKKCLLPLLLRRVQHGFARVREANEGFSCLAL